MKYTLDSNVETLTNEELIEYYNEFITLSNDSIREKNSFVSTYLAYTLPIQRMINTYEKALADKTFYKGDKVLSHRNGYEEFTNILWKALEGDEGNPDDIFYLGKIGEHISLWWHKQEKAIFNPKTDKMESIEDCLEDCEKYFSQFESEGNRFEFLLINCISLTLYGMSYCIESDHDCEHYDCNHILYYISEDLKTIVKSNLDVYKSPLFKEEFKAFQEDIKNALSANSVEDVKNLRESYKDKLYIPSVYTGEKYSF